VRSAVFNSTAGLVSRGKIFVLLSLSFNRLFFSFSLSLPLSLSSPLICPFHSHPPLSQCHCIQGRVTLCAECHTLTPHRRLSDETLLISATRCI
jgi:hypothetical protein